MADVEEKYTKLGALIGGAIFGFIVFGLLSLRLLQYIDGVFWPIVVAFSGSILGAWCQVKHGDYLWNKILRWWP
jgi:hypothetical protein